jgi:phosphoglycolate phosphatase
VRIGCVTNKASEFTLPILQDLGIRDYFETVLCGDMVERKKPDPQPLLQSAETLSVSPQESMMLGDSMSDVKAARAAGFSIVCMSYGYNHGEDIRDYNPDAVIDSMIEIKDIVDWG